MWNGTLSARDHPLGFFMTFGCYGARLPGDQRGTVDHARVARRATVREPHGGLEDAMLAALRFAPALLDARRRYIVCESLLEVCRLKSWGLHAANVRSNHVHVVVAAAAAPDEMLRTFKAIATRRLREAALLGAGEPIWSEHGWTRFLWDERALVAAVEYVVHHQGPPLPMVPPGA